MDQRIITLMPDRLVGAIDDYRFAHRIASRAAAIRYLIEDGLNGEASKAVTAPSEEEGWAAALGYQPTQDDLGDLADALEQLRLRLGANSAYLASYITLAVHEWLERNPPTPMGPTSRSSEYNGI